MRVLVACEFSGRVREAFRNQGHDAWSIDLEPTEIPGQHIQGDVLGYLDKDWDMMIAHPPCTYLTRAGAQYYQNSREQALALEFIALLMAAPISRIAIENPPGVIGTRIRKPDDTIQPWHFGHPESKLTCLWLKNLPRLLPTNIVYPPILRYGHAGYKAGNFPPGPNRWKERSRTFQGIADAMADQWGHE